MQKAENKQRQQASPKRRARKTEPSKIKLFLFKLKQKTNKMMEKKPVRYITVTLLCLVALVVVFRLFLLVFPIKHFEVSGDTRYDINEIIDAAGIRSGQRLYAINEKKAKNKLMAECPYIKDVNIKQKFPSTVCFEIEERVPGWYIEIGEDYYALDYDLKVLLETYDEQSLKVRGLTEIVLPELESAVVGEYPKFGKGDEHLISETLKIVDSMRTHRIKERLTYLDLENRFEIVLRVSETYEAKFGDMDDYETKLSMIEEIINQSVKLGYAGGEINVINPLAHTFRGYYAEAPEQKETDKAEDENQ